MALELALALGAGEREARAEALPPPPLPPSPPLPLLALGVELLMGLLLLRAAEEALERGDLLRGPVAVRRDDTVEERLDTAEGVVDAEGRAFVALDTGVPVAMAVSVGGKG